MPIVAAALAVAGAGVSFYGQQQAAKAAEITGKYNADLQRSEAEQTTIATAENARRRQRENTRVLAAQRNALAAAGLTLEGSPLAVFGDTAQALEREILDLGYEAQTKRRALLAGANLSVFESKAQASAMRTQSYASLASNLSSAATSYAQAGGFLTKSKTPASGTSSS